MSSARRIRRKGTKGRRSPPSKSLADQYLYVLNHVAEDIKRDIKQVDPIHETGKELLTLGNFHESIVRDSYRAPNAQPSACSKGCSFCCHLVNVVNIPEVFLLIHWTCQSLGEQGFRDLSNRVEEAFARWQEVPAERRYEHRWRCPVLIGGDTDGTCSAYDARPMTCRGWNSVRLGPCQAQYEAPGTPGVGKTEINAIQWLMATSIDHGIEKGLELAGIDSCGVYLIPALHIALSHPDVAARWLAGEPVFAEAHAPKDSEAAQENGQNLLSILRQN